MSNDLGIQQLRIVHRICSKKRPCHDARSCRMCARSRQRRIADAAERLGNRVGQLSWTILFQPADESESIEGIKKRWIRSVNPEGAIWTIEESKKTGLKHCNIISPATSCSVSNSFTQWQILISGNPRHVAAYIGKADQMPIRSASHARLWGTSGQLWDWLRSTSAPPLVSAAAAQHEINKQDVFYTTTEYLSNSKPSTEKHKNISREEARSIACRYLPDILSKYHARVSN